MTDVAAPQADGLVQSEVPAETTKGSAAAEAVTFSDVVRAHRAWETDFHKHRQSNPALRAEFEGLVVKFEARYGALREAYWSVRDASAVAVTVEKKTSLRHPLGDEIPRFHRATDWATRDEPAIAEALDDCETLAVKAEEVLRGATEKIALRRIYAVASHLLGFVDRTWGRHAATDGDDPKREREADDVESFVKRQQRELDKIELFYRRAGNKQARIVFFWGMVYGLLALLPVTVLAVTLIWVADGLDGETGNWPQLQMFMVSVFAGALGALLSVLTRMASLTGKFDLDHEVGRKQVRYLGFYRPFLGAIFGVATFLLLQSDLLETASSKSLSYFGALAFLAGFFERFMKVAPGGVPTPIEEDAALKEKETEPQL